MGWRMCDPWTVASGVGGCCKHVNDDDGDDDDDDDDDDDEDDTAFLSLAGTTADRNFLI
jgi:hypothetical protein